MDARISSWCYRGSHVLGDAIDMVMPVLRATERDLADVLVRQLCTMAHLSSESVLLLTMRDRAWGAEMIVRSVAESTVKAVCIDLAREEQRQAVAEDFWYAGLAIAHLKDDARLLRFLEKVENPDAPMWRPYRERIFADEEREDVESTYPPKERKEHERRWSFRELCQKLGASGNATYENLAQTAYLYAISSHVLHSDAVAVAVAADRWRRTDEERLGLEAAHAARLVCDVISFAFARVSAVAARRSLDPAQVKAWSQGAVALMDDTAVAHREFHAVTYNEEKGTLDPS